MNYDGWSRPPCLSTPYAELFKTLQTNGRGRLFYKHILVRHRHVSEICRFLYGIVSYAVIEKAGEDWRVQQTRDVCRSTVEPEELDQ